MKLLLVEDDAATSSALAERLIAHHYTVNLAADGQTALKLAEAYEYDLILLDIVLPELDGISLCKHLRAQGRATPILLMTAKDNSSDEILGLDAGADDYVVKPFDLEALIARVRALLRREKSLSTGGITWENLHFDPVNNEITCEEKPLHLTPKEYCLLELFLLNPKRIFSRRAILDRLWDFAESPGEETVSTHIKCLRQKLKKAEVADPIETVHGLGYRLRPSTSASIPEVTVSPSPPHQKLEASQRSLAERTAKIWEKFQDKFAEQVNTLQRATAALVVGQLTAELQQQAKHEAHKLAGTLGIFGLMEGSRIAKALEGAFQPQTLTAALANAPAAEQIVGQVQQLQRLLQNLPNTKAKPDLATHPDLILIVDDDVSLAEQVRVEAIAWNLRVELATDLTIARKVIAQSPPDVILLDLNFPGSENGLELLSELMQRIPRIPVLVFTGHGSLSDRLEVSRLGGCIFLQKPLPPQGILTAITAVLNQNQIHHCNRVMVVDDEEAVVERLLSLLQPLGVEVIGVSDPQQFWEMLTQTAPNLLILDLEMPGINGIELCRAVRTDVQWQRLPILFLSAHTTAPDLDRAFTAGADDYLSKSMASSEWVTRIIHRLKRIGFQNS